MGHHWQQLLDQTEVRLAECNVDLSVYESSALVLCSFGNGRVAMSQIGDSDTTSEVQVRLVIVPTEEASNLFAKVNGLLLTIC